MSINKFKYKKGFSLLELLLVLGIIAALVVSAFIVYPKIQAAQRADTELRNISTITAGIRTLYHSSPNFAGVNNDVLINSKIIPDNMLSADKTQIINSFGGTVIVSSATALTLPDSGISLTYNNIPTLECTKITTALLPLALSIRVNNVAMTSVSSLVAKCSTATTSNLIVIFI